MSSKPVQPIFGAASLVLFEDVQEHETAGNILDVVAQNGATHLDVSNAVRGSEALIGRHEAGKRFSINSKTPGGLRPGASTGINIVQHAREACENAGVTSLDVYVIHAPDPTLDLEDMLHGMNEAHQAGYFKRLGLSNFLLDQVEQVYSICSTKGWILPTVLESNYNVVSRMMETGLLPALRRMGISFYAYSPLAGGFLTKTAEQITSGSSGRFVVGSHFAEMYDSLYNKPSLLRALSLWADAAAEAGCNKAELAYRWTAFDSALSGDFGDAMIFGSSKPEQVGQVFEWLRKGSVGDKAKQRIDDIWSTVEAEAIIDNYHDWAKSNRLGGGFQESSKSSTATKV